jgi:hypothetical protein
LDDEPPNVAPLMRLHGATLGNLVYGNLSRGFGAYPAPVDVAARDDEPRCDGCGRRAKAGRPLVWGRSGRLCPGCVQLVAAAIAAAPDEQRFVRVRPRTSRPRDVDAAEDAIEAAFETVYSSERSDEERQRAIEDSGDLAETLAASREARRQFRGTGEMEISVETIRFLEEDEAEVSFVLLFPSPVVPRFPSQGHARLVGGEWKVARDTFCRLVASLGVHCPPRPG